MKSYVYLAQERIDALYSGDGNISSVTKSFEGNVSAGVVSGCQTYQESAEISTAMKLEHVINKIDISDIFSDINTYIHATMPMSWNSNNKIDANSRSTFWIGSEESAGNTIYAATRVLLIGSCHNIVGNIRSSDTYYSTSYIDAFLKMHEDRLDLKTLELKDASNTRRAHDDLRIIESIDKLEPLSKIDKETEKKRFLESRFINQYIEELRENYYGNYCKYEFVAQLLYSCLGIDCNNKLIRYVIAAPLYVSREGIIGNRTLYTTGGKKYVLSKDEFEAHKKHAFQSLAHLLIQENLVTEEKNFTSEMKNLFDAMGSHKMLLIPNKKAKFTERAIPIVLKYFYIANNT